MYLAFEIGDAMHTDFWSEDGKDVCTVPQPVPELVGQKERNALPLVHCPCEKSLAELKTVPFV